MAELYSITRETLVGIADSIRGKKGTSGLIPVTSWPDEIESIFGSTYDLSTFIKVYLCSAFHGTNAKDFNVYGIYVIKPETQTYTLARSIDSSLTNAGFGAKLFLARDKSAQRIMAIESSTSGSVRIAESWVFRNYFDSWNGRYSNFTYQSYPHYLDKGAGNAEVVVFPNGKEDRVHPFLRKYCTLDNAVLIADLFTYPLFKEFYGFNNPKDDFTKAMMFYQDSQIKIWFGDDSWEPVVSGSNVTSNNPKYCYTLPLPSAMKDRLTILYADIQDGVNESMPLSTLVRNTFDVGSYTSNSTLEEFKEEIGV